MLDLRPRRSVLYVPGSNPRALEKAQTLPADGVILDLEDAVAPEAKEQARARAVAAIQAGGWGEREVLLRVNGPDTSWGGEDLEAAATSGADGVVLPKVESADHVRVAEAGLLAQGAPKSVGLWAMIETPRGVLNVREIAESTHRLRGLILGTVDLSRALYLRPAPDRAALVPLLMQCVLVARAAGIAVLDGVHPDVADEEGFRVACRQGAALGFDGKTLIHPRTIEIANAAFGPTEAEVERARRVVAAYETALAEGKGVALLDGQLVEKPIMEAARRTLALAARIAHTVVR